MASRIKPATRPNLVWFAQFLPDWLNALLDAGIVSDDPQVRRRQRFTNVAAYALAFDTISHLVVNSFYDFWALLPVNVYNIVIATFCLMVHRLHRLGDNVVVNVLIAVSVVGHSYVVFAFGLDSNLQVYFTMAGFILVLVGVRHWRNFLLLYALSVAALVIVMTFAGEDGFLMSWDENFRVNQATQVMLATVVINAAVIAYILITLERAELGLQAEFERSELLLHTILPANIANRLKAEPDRRIADRLDNVTVLFADLVGFTPVAASAAPEEVVRYLHRLFSRFDALCETHGLDKIKTIGDSYMAVGGLRDDGGTGVRRAGRLALDMMRAVGEEKLAGKPLAMRIGIHSGPVIAGVIGDRRMTYDVWGDTVNFASRLQSHGAPGRIHVSKIYRNEAGVTFDFESRGKIDIKGFGEWETFFLTGLTTG